MPVATKKAQCSSRHVSTFERCIRRLGHVGACWGRWHQMKMDPGYAMRTEWVSREGKFHRHETFRKLFLHNGED